MNSMFLMGIPEILFPQDLLCLLRQIRFNPYILEIFNAYEFTFKPGFPSGTKMPAAWLGHKLR
jgi:hypothetical protein